MVPTLGRLVIYRTTDEQRQKMHDMENCNVQEELPAIVVAVWGESLVNLNVQLDGEGALWVTSAEQGDAPGEWRWPVIQK